MTTQTTPATYEELKAALTLAVRYLDHPAVRAIPFATPVENVATRIHTLLAS